MDQTVKETLDELKEEKERNFKSRVRTLVNEIIAIKNGIDDSEKTLKKKQEELRALKLEHPDYSALFE
jgi:hypothetical protein